jgi:hypothetical protein
MPNRRHAVLPLLFGFSFMALAAGSVTAADREFARERLQSMVDRLRSELAIADSVRVKIVPTNPLLVSVEPVEPAGGTNTYLMSFEEPFLAGLEDDELQAIVAHELGHVWIFTHHPYLQTERLANHVAMRAVSRTSLERVYVKVWERAGTKGDLAHFLGQ